MTKKLDFEDIVEQLVAEITRKVGRQSIEPVRPVITMRRPPARCTGITFKRFNELEYMTVQTMVNWAAANSNLPEATIRMRTAAMFDARNVEDIDREHYDEVVDYLADFDAAVN